MEVRMSPLSNRRGILLISSYLVLSLFLVYSSAMTLRTNTQSLQAQVLHNRMQATDLAEAALQQFTNDFNTFFASEIYQTTMNGNAVAAFAWLDDLGAGTADPALDLDQVVSVAGVAEGSGAGEAGGLSRLITLPTGTGEAWIVSVSPGVGLEPRDITIESKATVGGITKRLRAVYRMEMGMSDIFRYAYFLNNYGWLDVRGSTNVYINGEIRANGDLDITTDSYNGSGEANKIRLQGDIYASINPSLTNPITGQVAAGRINGQTNPALVTGDPIEYATWESYRSVKHSTFPRARPARRLVENGKPVIGGIPVVLPTGEGYDTDYAEQRKLTQQSTQDIPYLGNLTMYQDLAAAHNGGAGSTLTYNLPGANGTYGDGDDVPITLTATYNKALGPDQVGGTPDDGSPLIVVGTAGRPIVIDGPVVVPGDVIIRGVMSGRGTIYAGRNIHVVGSTTYLNGPTWPSVERNVLTGQLRETGVGSGDKANLGTVCNNGTYVPPGGAIPGGCT
jgi:hypothetical protein